jgi:phage N-6-adenine-methyltransferase
MAKMTSEQIIIEPMSRAEAEAHVVAIKNSAADMGRRLLDLKEREGWKVLGYETWTACLEGEFSYSRQHLYELMRATPVLESLSSMPYKLSTRAAVALADYEPELRPTIIKTTQARYGELTESNVNRVGRVVQEMATTGHVDIGNGTSTPIDAALDLEDHEASERRHVYIEEKMARKNGSDPLMSSNSKEWYTPLHIISLAQQVLGEINLDPATTDEANTVIQAKHIFTPETNGLEREWRASTLWLNPPYGDVIEQWVEKLIHEYRQGHFKAGIALLPARTDTAWWQLIRDYPRCFIIGRISFWLPGGETKYGAPFPSAAVYFGQDVPLFSDVFSAVGDTFVRVTL